jgi:hemerythrin superfamily protein
MVPAIATYRVMSSAAGHNRHARWNKMNAPPRNTLHKNARGLARHSKGNPFMPFHTSTSHAGMGRVTKARAGARGKAKRQECDPLLASDHDEVEKLFTQFQKSKPDGPRKGEILRRICTALTVHTEIEEEIFYPAVRDALSDKDQTLIDEAAIEHETIRNLVEEIEGSGSADEMLAARMKVLCEYVMHHVKEEEGKIFRKAKKARIDLGELGAERLERKMEPMAEEA